MDAFWMKTNVGPTNHFFAQNRLNLRQYAAFGQTNHEIVTRMLLDIIFLHGWSEVIFELKVESGWAWGTSPPQTQALPQTQACLRLCLSRSPGTDPCPTSRRLQYWLYHSSQLFSHLLKLIKYCRLVRMYAWNTQQIRCLL